MTSASYAVTMERREKLLAWAKEAEATSLEPKE
jgi:hypothetical protein